MYNYTKQSTRQQTEGWTRGHRPDKKEAEAIEKEAAEAVEPKDWRKNFNVAKDMQNRNRFRRFLNDQKIEFTDQQFRDAYAYARYHIMEEEDFLYSKYMQEMTGVKYKQSYPSFNQVQAALQIIKSNEAAINVVSDEELSDYA